MSDLDTLKAIKRNLLTQIEEMTAAPKPNYTIDGQAVSWQSLLDSLWDKARQIDEQIIAVEPYEIVSRGTSIE